MVMNKMRIISWNCGGGFRNKYHLMDELGFDLCIIQECEDPSSSPITEYKNWAGKHLWVGENRNKGIGVFTRHGHTTELCDLSTGGNKLFLPFKLNNSVNFLAVWTKGSTKKLDGYIAQLWSYLQLNIQHLEAKKSIIIGDFNSNAEWDAKRPERNHSAVVNLLNNLGMKSLYHLDKDEPHGKENEPTFFMHRNISKGYHIDYCFASSQIITNPHSLRLEKPSEWLDKSDHVPMLIQLNI